MSWSRRYEGEEPVRVNKWLAQSGVCSRREAEGLIAEGRVTIDGALVEDVGRKILPGQTLSLDEAGKGALDTKLTVLIHKPVGIVSSQPEGDQVPAVRLLRRANLFVEAEVYPNSDHRLAPLGRLDMDSRGLARRNSKEWPGPRGR
ncbi:MAG: pseudouridylate synthase [Caulobacter sp.]|nr:pseudouridylate synthase [Caulobacter sp.]